MSDLLSTASPSVLRRNWAAALPDETWISEAAKVRRQRVRLDIHKCLVDLYLWAADINGKLGAQVWNMGLSKQIVMNGSHFFPINDIPSHFL